MCGIANERDICVEGAEIAGSWAREGPAGVPAVLGSGIVRSHPWLLRERTAMEDDGVIRFRGFEMGGSTISKRSRPS